jgi:hypothetical protein
MLLPFILLNHTPVNLPHRAMEPLLLISLNNKLLQQISVSLLDPAACPHWLASPNDLHLPHHLSTRN